MFRVQVSSDELLVRRSDQSSMPGGGVLHGSFFLVKTTCLKCHQLERSVVGTTFFWHESGVEN